MEVGDGPELVDFSGDTSNQLQSFENKDKQTLNAAKEAFAQNKDGKSGARDSFRERESKRKGDKGKGEATGFSRN